MLPVRYPSIGLILGEVGEGRAVNTLLLYQADGRPSNTKRVVFFHTAHLLYTGAVWKKNQACWRNPAMISSACSPTFGRLIILTIIPFSSIRKVVRFVPLKMRP